MLPSIVAVAFLLSGVCIDDGAPLYSSRYAQCQDESEGVDAAMHDCIAAELELQDARLNAVYHTLADSESSPGRKKLVAAQRAWLKYRDANCEFYADPDGGTAAALIAHDCVLRETAERVLELDALKQP
jgi:uncharacterized protein YecT (DUF1311 family)